MPKKTLHDIFLEELRDIHSAERQLVRALPKLARAASAPELKQAIEHHLVQTNQQVARLDQAFETLGAAGRARGRKCEAMEGLIAEAQEIMEMDLDPAAMDAALIAAAQKVEHYEIASYGSVCAWAKAMKHDEALTLLSETLEEERAADATLTKVARSVNKAALEEVGAA